MMRVNLNLGEEGTPALATTGEEAATGEGVFVEDSGQEQAPNPFQQPEREGDGGEDTEEEGKDEEEGDGDEDGEQVGYLCHYLAMNRFLPHPLVNLFCQSQYFKRERYLDDNVANNFEECKECDSCIWS